jgi:hypothetical protein
VLTGRGEQALHVVERQPAEVNSLEVARASQLHERGRKWMGAVNLDVTIGAHQQETRTIQVPRNVEKHVEGAAIGVMQILQHQE